VPGVLRMAGPLHLDPVLVKGFIDESGAPLSGVPSGFRLARPMPAAPEPVGSGRPAPVVPRTDGGDVDGRARIIAALTSGPKTERELQELTGLSSTSVNRHLRAMGDQGRVQKAGGNGAPWALATGR
jgi:hypothetical protein